VGKKPCMKCGGDGYIPQYSWNANGICFECDGTGYVTEITIDKINKRRDIEGYMNHVSTRDLLESLIDAKKQGKRVIPTNSTTVMREVTKRLKRFGIKFELYSPGALNSIERGLQALDKLERETPQPWKKSAYVSAGKVDEVPVHWLKKFQGNPLRRDKAGMTEFAWKLKSEGLEEPILIIIGQEDRRVSIGEGNHRTFAFEEAGFDKIPARVMRQRTNPSGVYYDKMDKVPVDDYFKGDASPKEVFDTYYDADSLPKLTPKKDGYHPYKIDGGTHKNVVVDGIYAEGKKEPSSKVEKLVSEMEELRKELDEKDQPVFFTLNYWDILERIDGFENSYTLNTAKLEEYVSMLRRQADILNDDDDELDDLDDILDLL
jgi:ParB-like nuclease domain